MTPFSLPTRITFGDQSALKRVLTDKLSHAPCVLFLREDDADRLKIRTYLENRLGTDLIWIKPDERFLENDVIDSIAQDLRALPINQVLAFGDQRVTRLAKAVMAKLPRKDVTMSALLIGSDPEILNPTLTVSDRLSGILRLDCADSRFNDLLICEPLSDLSDRKAILEDGLGALAMASQAYWAPSTSPIVQRLALKAIELIIRNLPKVISDPQAMPATLRLIDGFLLTSMAFSNVITPRIHDIALRLGSKTKVSSSWIEAKILPDLLRHNLSGLTNPEGLYEAYDIDNPEALGEWIEKITGDGSSNAWTGFGLAENDLEAMITAAYADPALDPNPVDLSEDQLKTILMKHRGPRHIA